MLYSYCFQGFPPIQRLFPGLSKMFSVNSRTSLKKPFDFEFLILHYHLFKGNSLKNIDQAIPRLSGLALL